MNPSDASDWLIHAEGDLSYARLGRQATDILPELVAFHVQQAVEKGLKAVLVKHQLDFPKTHDLEELLFLIQEGGLNYPVDGEKAKKLTPGFDEPITPAEIDEAITVAEKIVEWARQVIDQSESGNL